MKLIAGLVLKNRRVRRRQYLSEDYGRIAGYLIKRYGLESAVEKEPTISVSDQHADFFIRDLSMLRIVWTIYPPDRAQFAGESGTYGLVSLHPMRSRVLFPRDRKKR